MAGALRPFPARPVLGRRTVSSKPASMAMPRPRTITPTTSASQGMMSVTDIHSSAPSDNSVPDHCRIRLDRRFDPGPSREELIGEIKRICGSAAARIAVPAYRAKSWRGLELAGEKYFPAWLLDAGHPLIETAVSALSDVRGEMPPIGVWGFSTNGASITGKFGIPSFGVGPGKETFAHQPDERVQVSQLFQAAEFYACFTGLYASRNSAAGAAE